MPKKMRILLAVDGSENSLRMAERVASLAAGTEAEIVIFHVLPPVERGLLAVAQPEEMGTFLGIPAGINYAETLSLLQSAAREGAEATIQQTKEVLTKNGVPAEAIQEKIEEGALDVARAIVKEAQEGGYTIVAVGRKGRSALGEFLIGSTADKVVRHCTGCTVLVGE